MLAVHLAVGDRNLFCLCAAAGGVQALRSAGGTDAVGERQTARVRLLANLLSAVGAAPVLAGCGEPVSSTGGLQERSGLENRIRLREAVPIITLFALSRTPLEGGLIRSAVDQSSAIRLRELPKPFTQQTAPPQRWTALWKLRIQPKREPNAGPPGVGNPTQEAIALRRVPSQEHEDDTTIENGLVAFTGKDDLAEKHGMPNELKELDFSLDDVIGGQPLTLENVDYPTFRGFLDEVETLIKGNVPGASLADSRLRIETGSVKVVAFVAPLLAADLQTDMARLEETGDLDALQPKRAGIIETWQTRAHRSPNRRYFISGGAGVPAISVLNGSQFQHRSENAWVSVEKYLTGKVVNAGGKQDPNNHLVLAESGESLRISATEQQLAAEKENQLYKEVTLRVQAEQHLRSKQLRDIRLIQFLPHTREVDEQALATLWEKGRNAWRNVQSATGWVETLRGNQ